MTHTLNDSVNRVPITVVEISSHILEKYIKKFPND